MIGILGDLHLGKGSNIAKEYIGNFGINSRIMDQVKILDWVTNQCLDNNICDLFLTGDIFEEPKPSPNIIKLFINFLNNCYINNLNVHIVYGNHDILRSGQFYSSALDIINDTNLENVFLYNMIESISIDNFYITLVPFVDRKSFNVPSNKEALDILRSQINDEVNRQLSKKKMVIGHLALEGAIYVGDEVDDLSNELICPLDMFDEYDYVFMGHVHKPQVLKNIPRICHTGSADISNFSENHDKIFIMVSDKINEIKIQTRPLYKIELIIPDDVDYIEYIKNNIPKDFNKGIVSLTLISDNNINRKVIESLIYENNAFHISNFSERKKIKAIKKKMEISDEISEKSILSLYANNFIEENLREEFKSLGEDIINRSKDL